LISINFTFLIAQACILYDSFEIFVYRIIFVQIDLAAILLQAMYFIVHM